MPKRSPARPLTLGDAIVEAAADLPCEFCGAAAGRSCTYPNGKSAGPYQHNARTWAARDLIGFVYAQTPGVSPFTFEIPDPEAQES